MNNKLIDAILVEDEPLAQELFRMKLEPFADQISLRGGAYNISEARALIEEREPDLVFLDIQMPDGTGFELLEHFPDRNFYVIFVSSHSEYALEAIKNEAFDFLTKPVNEDELRTTIERIVERLTNPHRSTSSVNPSGRLEVCDSRSCSFIQVNDILCVKASGSYVEIVTQARSYTVSQNLGSFSKKLDPERFFRCHNSYLVNLHEALEYIHEGNYLRLSNDDLIRVSSRKKAELFEALRRV